MQLYVLSRYRAGAVHYEPGQVLDVSEAEAQRLLADSPGSFTTERPAPDAPPDQAGGKLEPPTDVDQPTEENAADDEEDAEAPTEEKALDEPPKDKMVKRSPKTK